ncbi:unnamed protein product [Sphenostylis stenocarpa]|uniref:Uncharacterized protein n=1 Tax=Sphenostylis stenocarpa TaxID=92480 RepID=A0AA86STN1_9FABA|nr:unnamed protein product [Sphenostylis stenocarpa]
MLSAVATIGWLRLFSFWRRSTCAVRSSKCCCFRILDLLADSRFDCFLFFFLCSIRSCRSSSDPELCMNFVDMLEVPQDEAITYAIYSYTKVKALINLEGKKEEEAFELQRKENGKESSEWRVLLAEN